MAEHPDDARFRRALSARGEVTLDEDAVAVLNDLFADDVVGHGAANGSGEVKGKQAAIALWNILARPPTGAAITVREVYADGRHVAALVQISSDRTAVPVDQANIFHMTDGRVTEFWGLPTDEAVAEALATGEPMPEHPNVAAFFAAQKARQRAEFGPEDLATMEHFFADNVRWYMSGATTWADTPPSSLEDVIMRFKMFKQATGGTLFVNIREVFADDTHALGFTTLTADRPDRPDKHMNAREVSVFHLDADARAYEFWGIPADEAERDGFWAND